MTREWRPETVAFMRAVLRAGGERRISTRSKYRSLALCLARDGMVRTVHHANGVATYRVTDAGRAEFS